MTQERKDKLLGEMLSWISDHIPNDQDLFLTLYENIGMTREELRELDIECLDGFFPNEETEEATEVISEAVQPIGISLSDFITEVSGMVSSDDKTAVLDWIEFAGFMVDSDEEGARPLEKELFELYLPLCYVKNNFSNAVLQQSLDMDTLGNEIIFGAILFSAGYDEDEIRQLGNEGALVDGYSSQN